MAFSNKKLFLLCLLLITADWLIYGQALSFGLITQDDFITINYPKIHPNLLSRPMTIFTTPMPESAFFWMPVSGLSFLTDILICPSSYHVLHLTNLILHACNAIILFLLLHYTTKKTWAGFLVALIFTVHPLNVETVVVITNRAALLSTFFWMMTIVAYVYYAQHPSACRYGLMIMFFVLGLMAKPSIAGYVFFLPLLDLWPLYRWQLSEKNSTTTRTKFAISSTKKLIFEKIPLFVLAIGWGMMTSYFFTRIPYYRSPVFAEAKTHIFSRIFNLPVSWCGYLYKFLAPIRLNYFTPAPPLENFSIGQGLAAALMIAVITLFLLIFLRRYKPLVTGWLWFLICITPAALTNALMQNFITGRYAYFPMIGLAITVVWGLSRLAKRLSTKRKRLIQWALIALTLVFLGLAREQTGNWESLISLYRHAISIDPDKSIHHLNLGKALYQNRELEQAVVQFHIAQKLCPQCPEPLINLGLTYRALNKSQHALMYFEKARSIQPNDMIINQNLATLYLQQNRSAEAITLLKGLLDCRPEYSVSITYHLAMIYARQNNSEKAVFWLKKSAEKNPVVLAMAEQEPVFDSIKKTDQWRDLRP